MTNWVCRHSAYTVSVGPRESSSAARLKGGGVSPWRDVIWKRGRVMTGKTEFEVGDVNRGVPVEEQPERIRRRAYELYEARGREDGHEVEDWLQAEAEVAAGERPVTDL